ncbi:PLP-dependent aminotransferase family protein [Robertmurraya korlensis]|uniref:MocR-like pyridoxine biosynthesis transcription factor PdxR n=1 Tax=Robertmurraya korlensis TaxID=519977 RepID=UPI00203AFABC|nr:PLP-dependent aminotransferase family protein [Robertmurraya korlensis]MCM3600911.1 PLP-dependent aminotransferase family protein [Robertmurraya korlensis]
MKELVLQLNDKSPKYKQIYEHVRSLIEEGLLLKDTKLPSIRQLAIILHVSRNTTLIAYEQLVAEGYIRSEEKKGYFVEVYEPMDLQQSLRIENHLPSSETSIKVNFRAGTIDQQAFPLKAWRKCSNDVLKEDMIYCYGDNQGDPLLRSQLSSYLLQSRGIQTTPEQIIIGSSTQQLLMHLSLFLQKDFSSIAVENPGYDGARVVFQLHDYHLHPIEVGSKGLSLKQLERTDSKLVYITPSHQFPTGVTMPVPERQQLLKWAEAQNGFIIEDDYDSEFRYKQQPIPALVSLQPGARVIYLGTFSKAFIPSIRLSYMVLPSILIKPYVKQFSGLEQGTSSIHQRTMARFMEQGFWNSHIRKMRTTYKRKMHTLVTCLQNTFGEKIEIIGSQSGLYVLIRFRGSTKEEQLIQQALSHGVKVYPTSNYFVTNEQRTILKLGFSNLSIEQIQLGVQLLKQAWRF